jgi:ferredoxin
MAVRASGQGKEAAFSISQFLSGEEISGEPRKFNSRFGKLMQEEFSAYLLESIPGNRTDPAGPQGFSSEEVMAEAARCMHCDCRKLDNCRLRDLSHEYGASQRHYWEQERKPVRKSIQHDLVIYESRKCIKCSLCVRIAEKHGEKIGFTFIGRGFDVEIGAPLNEDMNKALTVSAIEAAEACPTGALALKEKSNKR